MLPPRRAERLVALAATTSLALALAACGGGSTPSGSASPSGSPSPSASVGSTTRPEGPWTLVAWTVKRSDTTVEQRSARAILGTFDPSCETGACELTLSPAGADGTYREPEAPPGDGATPLTLPFTLAWKGSTYEGTLPFRVGSCTNAKGELVEKGYSTSTSMSLTFVPPAASAPARLHGTVTHVSKGTPASRKRGCTDFTETEAVTGVPTGSVAATAVPAGEYEGSLSTTATTPKRLAAVGSALWLGTMTVAGDAAAPTITGLARSTGPLTTGADGWSAAPPAGATQCRAPDGTVVDAGADGTETFGGLHAVALTKDGKPIFAGSWRLRSNPNAKGLKARCALAVYEGRLYLVPRGAG
ncbi:hypothetical protein [Oryzobacter terrae]|uniref:hypothetical protein n=1 Tax=Oryzobacter terrae TaxID=1620385 RepID=UPI00366D6C2C